MVSPSRRDRAGFKRTPVRGVVGTVVVVEGGEKVSDWESAL